MTPRMPWTSDELAKLVDSYRTEAEDGHARLRQDFRTHHTQTDDALILLRDGLNTLRSRVDLIERTPPDVTKLRFSTGVVVSLLFFTASVIGAGYAFSEKVEGRIDALAKRFDEQAVRDAKSYDERAAVWQRSIDSLTRNMELLKYEQQRLREDVTKAKGSTR